MGQSTHSGESPAQPAQATTSPHALFIASAILLGAALLAGGRSAQGNHLIVQLAALPALFMVLATPAVPTLAGRFALGALGVAALQLIPLPPGVWTALPGRQDAALNLAAAGIAPGWRPLALDPGAAAIALSTLFAPLVLYFAVIRMGARQIRWLLAGVAGFALASAVLAVLQKTTGQFSLYGGAHSAEGTGLMINRNHQADILLVGLLLLPCAFPPERRRRLAPALTLVVLAMALSVTATTSKMGMLLTVPAVLCSLAVLWRLNARRMAGLVGAIVAAGAALLFVPALAPAFARFSAIARDERWTMNDNTMFAIREYWPFGSGYGSFEPVYARIEDLDTMGQFHVVAAHNDYLQIVLEGGLPGLLTILGALLVLAIIGWRNWSRAAPTDAWAPFVAAVLLLAHSAADFPLRMAALAVVLALCVAACDAMQQPIANSRAST